MKYTKLKEIIILVQMILKTSFNSYHNDRSGFLTPFTLMSRLWACPTLIKKINVGQLYLSKIPNNFKLKHHTGH